jgi:hypothetical protein
MAAGLAAAQIVVVHRRQIVMHQRVGVQQLHRRPDAGGTAPVDAEQGGTLHHQNGAQPLAAAQAGIAHRLHHPRLGPLR